MTEIEKLLLIKKPEQKEKILNWITTSEIEIDRETKDNIVDAISCFKNFLNEELKDCENLVDTSTNSNLYISLINSKNKKVDRLIDLYNESNTHNKIRFIDNEINFDKITTIESIRLEIDDFDFLYPLKFGIIFITYDGEYIARDIIPFNYNGLFNEFIDLSTVNQSTFKVANRKNIYFYSCDKGEGYFSVGSELNFIKGKHYDFTSDGFLYINKDVLSDNNLLIKYQPSENSFDIEVNRKLVGVKLTIANDFVGVEKNLNKKLVIN